MCWIVVIGFSAGKDGGEAVGTIVPRLNDNFKDASEKKKYLFCDGSTYSSSKYPKLYAILKTTNLPDLRNKYLQGNTVGNTTVEAGLPNITGKLYTNSRSYEMSMFVDGYGMTYTGALYLADYFYNSSFTGGSQYYNPSTIGLDASRSNSIYGKSTTVTPPSVTVRYYIRAE